MNLAKALAQTNTISFAFVSSLVVLMFVGCSNSQPMTEHPTVELSTPMTPQTELPTQPPLEPSTPITPQTELPTQPPPSGEEIIGLLQEHLRSQPAPQEVTVSGSILDGGTQFTTYQDDNCLIHTLKYITEWKASQSDSETWIVTAQGKEGPWGEWHLFPSGIITTIKGPC